ncbi:ribosomal protein S6 kinase-related protein [Strongylocentrotus purpuratus]|uniref:Protein kinase domain-containing protein n=2 Tax=Strongylocentrotus purpuratus TaxID=7668 RepID=A0A7M7P8B0_STRPU|nr:ribosomal protein S6 kinase-related protein [Strongylocentrotus purpuratus]
MGGKHSRSQRRQSSASQSQRSIPSRSSSDHSFQRIWSRTSRRRRSVVSLTDPYLASRTTWPVPQSEAMFLPEYEVNPRSAEQEYKILHQINKGAYGQVLKVQRKEDGENYAMKVLSKLEVIRSEAIKQCKEEVSIQAMVGHHPFIIQIYKSWQSKINLHIVMEFATHGDLYTLWILEGVFTEMAVCIFIAELSMALDYLQNAGVIYRDLKMENILLDQEGHIKLTDFGLSKWMKKGNRASTICGTLQYMAPEILNEENYTHAVDWWSLGIIMYTLLTGGYPIDGAKTHFTMYSRVLAKKYVLPSSISSEACDALDRLLRKDPNDRLQSLGEIVHLDFIKNISLEQLVRREITPKDYLKRRLPRTLARKSTNKKGREFLYDKIPCDFTVDNFEWTRVTQL